MGQGEWAQAQEPPSQEFGFTRKNHDALVANYLRELRSFNKKSCSSKDRRRFDRLYRAYQKRGHYVPFNDQGRWDKKTIREYFPVLAEKRDWLRGLRQQLPSEADFKAIKTRPVQQMVDQLLRLKRDHRKTVSPKEKQRVMENSREKMQELSKTFQNLLQRTPFLVSFRHPVDHLENRSIYQRALSTPGRTDENRQLFLRKILEDGTTDRDLRQRDFYLRTTIDSVSLELNKSHDFITENLRYDLEWVISAMNLQLKRGRSKQQERLKFWQERVQSAINFYSDVLNDRIPASQRKSFSEATRELRDFVYRKHVQTYRHFSKQPEAIRALFAFDQILLNEVGEATAENYRARRDVAQVVVNRYSHPIYSRLSQSEVLYRKTGRLPTANYPWLNVLFKEGEFSFTYYFMSAVVHTFCPDYYRTARETRKKNLYLALDVLRDPNDQFPATRYFSRVSMTGRIDMSTVWQGYQRIAERPGRKRQRLSSFTEQLKSESYRYLYQFASPQERVFDVIELKEGIFAVSGYPESPEFYNYRNPHLFSFFVDELRQPSSSD